MTFADTLTEAFKARLPLLYIETGEEVRAIGAISDAAETQRHPRALWTWTAALGLVGPDGKAVASTANPARALQHVAGVHEPSVFVFCDLHAYFGGEHRAGDPALVRTVRETALEFRHGDVSRTLVITAPVRVIPPELDEVTHLLDFPLPTAAEIRELLETMIDNNASGDGRIRVDADDTARDQLVHAALGLSMAEAENAFARAMVNDGRLSGQDVPIVLDEKRQVVRKSGVLEFVRTEVDLDDVGGLENLKRWLRKRNGSWLATRRAYGLPAPEGRAHHRRARLRQEPDRQGDRRRRGGCRCCASTSAASSRASSARASRTCAPRSRPPRRSRRACCGSTRSRRASSARPAAAATRGTTARVFGTFLTWMQEKTAPVFVVATANDIDAPAAGAPAQGPLRRDLLRRPADGRIEREVIWRLQLRSRATDANGLEAVAADEAAIAALVASSENHSGAEIEQSVVSALYEGFTTRGEVTAEVVREVVDTMIPLAVTQAEEVQRIRTWATERAVRATGTEDLDPAELTGAVTEGALSSRRGGRTVDY